MDQRHVRGDERRVVVTGLGVVSPYGRGCEVYWQGLAQGQCLIGPLERSFQRRFRSRLAAGQQPRQCVLWGQPSSHGRPVFCSLQRRKLWRMLDLMRWR